ncbi:nucleotidyltransferase family protein [Pseudobacter ginsenosidimutans]|uniref:Nucleotidyltransferase-like protein n=1 Tax=Pseudobacter ginsenosidimutans TaxID=661488 RepID=A0A4Q7MH17_9BACT|nr:sugar phosphate nucleotidyltransferase [Pseudobacter ginsenosidimutans]QEC45418.1 nucleotidyltransferase [Pseudobacter ginsenosidimutans]RZS66947.1 nucleotidyltransferase-like protein [Pseudobacter ginsenosidimutans]
MQPTLLILAAGMASRYGSMKQIQSFGPGGETIMDYSIYDAIRAGYKKVVFIIRKEFKQDFAAIFEPRLEGKVEIDYVYQEVAEGRTKPWGTAQAILCGKDTIKEPFAVINADDFYGRDAFEKSYKFLTTDVKPDVYSIIGYELLKTLSDNGTVNRGVCQVDAEGNLSAIAERLNIQQQDGKILTDDNQEPKELALDSKVSMNFWCFDPAVFTYTENMFREFEAANRTNPKAEFFIPLVADQFIKDKAGVIRVIPTSSKWFGVTYKEDAPEVKAALEALVAAGEYPPALWK